MRSATTAVPPCIRIASLRDPLTPPSRISFWVGILPGSILSAARPRKSRSSISTFLKSDQYPRRRWDEGAVRDVAGVHLGQRQEPSSRSEARSTKLFVLQPSHDASMWFGNGPAMKLEKYCNAAASEGGTYGGTPPRKGACIMLKGIPKAPNGYWPGIIWPCGGAPPSPGGPIFWTIWPQASGGMKLMSYGMNPRGPWGLKWGASGAAASVAGAAGAASFFSWAASSPGATSSVSAGAGGGG
mmetsp:Transcript_15158/g.35697  ORF Transcript_15158/g.35697 Transcript_15158/m.35697 type:complete len:242 (-) Transcript_15158:52-777(-)